MTKAKFNLAKMIAARFSGYTRADLEKAALMLLPKDAVDGNDSDEDIITALCAKVNVPAPNKDGEQIPPGERIAESGVAILPPPKITGLGRLPNLSSVGKWEGRKRRVQFAQANNPEATITLGWNGDQKWTIKTPDIVDMPWPYWERVRTSIHVDDRSNRARKFKHDEEGKLYVEVKPRKTATYQYVDLGDVPGTEGLPTSYWDYFRTEALKNHCFRGFGRTALVMVFNKLRDGYPSGFFKDKDNMELRRLIAEILDPSLVAELDEEAYAADAGKSVG